jgi:2-polyprenyl-3-methyl-5-hydroxy-6-metoxy-1,4-benzoquinol methylase
MFDSRSPLQEIIDLGREHYTKEEYDDCLYKLGRVGRWLGGDRATLSSLSKMKQKPLSILDVGCGGGLFTIRLAKQHPQAWVCGIDLNPDAIQFAKKALALMRNPPQNLSFEIRAEPELKEPIKSFDVVTSTLVCHHLSDETLQVFIRNACRVSKKMVFINDLHRHPLAFALFKLVSPICFRNRLVLHDGPLSIQRAFKYLDLVNCLERAGLQKSFYRISWHWAFRWMVEINSESFCD